MKIIMGAIFLRLLSPNLISRSNYIARLIIGCYGPYKMQRMHLNQTNLLYSKLYHLQILHSFCTVITIALCRSWKTGLKVVNFDKLFRGMGKKHPKKKKILISQISLKRDFLNRKKQLGVLSQDKVGVKKSVWKS